LLRSISKGGKAGESLGEWAVWSVIEQSAKEIGIERFGALPGVGAGDRDRGE
jgi:hypothetical protein